MMKSHKTKTIIEDIFSTVDVKKAEGKGGPRTTGYYVRYAPMPKEEFIEIRKSMCLSQQELAQVLNTSVRAVQTYEQDVADVSGPVVRIMRLMKDNQIFRVLMLEDFMGTSDVVASFLKQAQKDIPVLQAKTKELKEMEDSIKHAFDSVKTQLRHKAVSLCAGVGNPIPV